MGLAASVLSASLLDANTTAFFAIVTDIGPSNSAALVTERGFRPIVATARARLWTTLLAFLGLGAGFGLVSNVLFNVLVRLILPQVSACRMPLAAACTVMLINLGLAFVFFPETLGKQAPKKNEDEEEQKNSGVGDDGGPRGAKTTQVVAPTMTRRRQRKNDSSRGDGSTTTSSKNDSSQNPRLGGLSHSGGSGPCRFAAELLGSIKFLMRNAQTRTYALVLAFYHFASVASLSMPWWTDLRFHWRELDFSLWGCSFVVVGLVMYGVVGPCILKRASSKKLIMVALPIGCIAPALFGLAWKPWMWYVAGVLWGPAVLAEPLLLATMSSSFSEAEQGEFSGAYQSVKGLAKFVSPFIIMALFTASVEGYDCEADGLEFRPAAGAIFYYSAAMTTLAAVIFWCRRHFVNAGDGLITPVPSIELEEIFVEDRQQVQIEEGLETGEWVAAEVVRF